MPTTQRTTDVNPKRRKPPKKLNERFWGKFTPFDSEGEAKDALPPAPDLLPATRASPISDWFV